MQFDIITIFPKIFDSYFNESIIKRARKNKKIKINVINLRDFTNDKSRLHSNRGSSTKWSGHKTVDEKPYGGGAGMVFKIEPLTKALETLKNLSHLNLPLDKGRKKEGLKKTLVILFSPAGKQFNSKMASNFAKKYDCIVMIADHYEGIDERVEKVIKNLKFKIKNLSIGPYVLTGGELPAMVIVDAISRHIPGVLGKYESLEEKRYGVGVPTYTRPEIFVYNKKKYKVPKILLSGNHKKIADWKIKHRKE